MIIYFLGTLEILFLLWWLWSVCSYFQAKGERRVCSFYLKCMLMFTYNKTCFASLKRQSSMYVASFLSLCWMILRNFDIHCIFFSILLIINSNFHWVNHICLKEPIYLATVVNTNTFDSGQYCSTCLPKIFDLYLHQYPKVSICKEWWQNITSPTPNLWVFTL